jgi:hypothetical protein
MTPKPYRSVQIQKNSERIFSWRRTLIVLAVVGALTSLGLRFIRQL